MPKRAGKIEEKSRPTAIPELTPETEPEAVPLQGMERANRIYVPDC